MNYQVFTSLPFINLFVIYNLETPHSQEQKKNKLKNDSKLI